MKVIQPGSFYWNLHMKKKRIQLTISKNNFARIVKLPNTSLVSLEEQNSLKRVPHVERSLSDYPLPCPRILLLSTILELILSSNVERSSGTIAITAMTKELPINPRRMHFP
jgi:hypothetical protein